MFKKLLSFLGSGLLAISLGVSTPAMATEVLRPGKILQVEKVSSIPAYLQSHTRTIYRILYTTTDSWGKLAKSSGVVFIPRGKTPSAGWPVVSWAHGTTGISDTCAPSINLGKEKVFNYVNKWLAKGYAVVASDYIGLGTAGIFQYLHNEQEAYGVIDGVHAAHYLPEHLTNKWVIVGHSEGGAAAIRAGQMANKVMATRQMGSKLPYLGVVSLGTPANLNRLISLFTPNFPGNLAPAGAKSFILYILAGLSAAYPQLNLRHYLTPYGNKQMTLATQLCTNVFYDRAENIDFSKIFTIPLAAIPGITDAANAYLQVPSTGYDRPIFLGQGLADTTVPTVLTTSLALELQANRQPVAWHSYPQTDHTQLLDASFADATSFVQNLFTKAPHGTL